MWTTSYSGINNGYRHFINLLNHLNFAASLVQNLSLAYKLVQCPLDIATLDLAAALSIATSTPVTNLCHYINSNLVYNDLRIQPLCSK